MPQVGEISTAQVGDYWTGDDTSSPIVTPSAAAMSRTVAQVGLLLPPSIIESVGIAMPAR
jgi:hypothetical protein